MNAVVDLAERRRQQLVTDEMDKLRALVLAADLSDPDIWDALTHCFTLKRERLGLTDDEVRGYMRGRGVEL